MDSKPKLYVVIACIVCLTAGIFAGYLPGYYSHQNMVDNTLTQVSTIDAILNGLYDGVITYGELKGYGDFGIGTFVEGLNVPGYHLHFITEDRTAGGHELEFVVKDTELTVDYTS